MANNGIDADKAATSLKTGLARLVSPAKEGAEMIGRNRSISWKTIMSAVRKRILCTPLPTYITRKYIDVKY